MKVYEIFSFKYVKINATFTNDDLFIRTYININIKMFNEINFQNW